MSLRIQSNLDVVTNFEPANSRSQNEIAQGSAALELDKERQVAANDLSEYEQDIAENVETAINSINGAMEYINRGLRFSIHEGTQRVMVKVVNVLTDEVIKELPPEAILDTAARIREMIGLLVDERA